MGRALKFIVSCLLMFNLSGCSLSAINPQGDIALQQESLIRTSIALMLLIVVPVFISILFFAWRYRASNKKARYDPEWCHSTWLELVIWFAPLVIVYSLATITWDSTRRLDPYSPLARISATKAIPQGAEPLIVEVVALNWKWLFFLPQYGVAVVNELVAPVDRPLEFRITASSVMNSFYVPALAGQIYAMAGMETKLHAVINREGAYNGFSANYSGRGFSHMHFKFYGASEDDFNQWIAKIYRQGNYLDREKYLLLEMPSERDPVQYFSPVETGLYNAILNFCVRPGKICINDMMQIDRMGGGGIEGINRLNSLEHDRLYKQQDLGGSEH
ncbi:ubiquinol oxidase subunit II [Candidatus Liberibacter sp.]|uniref:ubiquinol oxidase subunit II n=1 Tax=Candidatus Liberibacter sp. TaxID=34022 RepID=UPI0015F3C805|nr:ubiquinol oxidase subunit II [Candidatus Liberibacter sp.]MBA5724146.1 ubiquinol oxidase subunit II [Candidatus Liberibacter sp.]